ncbi:DoxX family protein [Nocardia camponoti]|nr:DoxX family protein [Nocardia camponoti]
MATLAENLLLLLVRVIVGVAFIAGSRTALKDVPAFAQRNNVPMPIAWFTGIAELLGAIGILLGLWVFLPALGLMALMLGAGSMKVFVWKTGYWANKNGWEYDLMLFTFCAVLVKWGAGDFSIDGIIDAVRD